MKPCKCAAIGNYHFSTIPSPSQGFENMGHFVTLRKIGFRSWVSKSEEARLPIAAFVVSCPTCTKYLEWYLVGICIKVYLLCYVLQIFDGMKIDFISLATFLDDF